MRFARTQVPAARQAGWLFLSSGFLAFANSAMPGVEHSLPLLGLGALDFLVGLTAWLAPWHRWHPRLTLVIVPVAFAVIGLFNRYGEAPPQSYGVFFVLVFAWTGAYHPPRTSTCLAPLAVVAYVVPFVTGAGDIQAVRSVGVAVPVGVLVGETISAVLARSQHRAALLWAVVNASRQINQLSSDQVLEAVTASLSAVGHEGVAFAFVDAESGTFRIAHSHGVPPEYATATHALDTGMPALVWKRRSTVVLHDSRDLERSMSVMRDAGFQSGIAAPVWVNGELAAVLLAFDRRKRRVDGEDIEAVEALAGAASTALTNARRFEQERQSAEGYERAALLDTLTGIGNRRHADHLLASLVPGDAVVVMDLDYFKSINDTFGHVVGDEVLAALGEYLRTHVRGADTVARHGGEEFICILRSVQGSPKPATDRLVAGWREQRPLTTISAGVAIHQRGSEPSVTFARADAALYTAKRGGRDRAQVWDETMAVAQQREPALVAS